MYFKKHIYRYFLFSAVPGIALLSQQRGQLGTLMILGSSDKGKI